MTEVLPCTKANSATTASKVVYMRDEGLYNTSGEFLTWKKLSIFEKLTVEVQINVATYKVFGNIFTLWKHHVPKFYSDPSCVLRVLGNGFNLMKICTII